MAGRLNPTIFDKLAASQNTWTIKSEDRTRGPYTTQQMQAFIAEKQLAPNALVAVAGESTYRAAAEVPMLARLFTAASPGARSNPEDRRDAAQPAHDGAVRESLIAAVEGFKEGVLQVDLDRYTDRALRANVRRELDWLLNTTNLESTMDLTPFPHIKTSVLNYGVADLAGKAQSRIAIAGRAARIREAILAFEPRLDSKSLSVEAVSTGTRENAVTYLIAGDIASALEALSVRYVTDVETDTGNADVRE